MDKDTKEVLTEGEELTNMSNSKGWRIARGKLVDKILDLQNIHNLPDETGSTSIENVVIDIKARKAAVTMLYAWLREIEGSVEQHKSNKEMMTNIEEKDGYIDRKK